MLTNAISSIRIVSVSDDVMLRETLDFLEQRQITVHVLPTEHAVPLYNKLAQTEAVGGLFHTTC